MTPGRASSPVRTLGGGGGGDTTAAGAGEASAYGDGPYGERHDVAAGAGEREPLLGSDDGAGKRAAGAASSGSSNYGAAARTPSVRSSASRRCDNRPAHTRPLLLKLSFAFSCLLLYVAAALFVLTCTTFDSPLLAHVLPVHRGSTFVPLWLCLLACLTQVLGLLALALPNDAPAKVLAPACHALVAVAALVALILSLAVTELRQREGALTAICAALCVIAGAHAALATALVERYADRLATHNAAEHPPTTDDLSVGASLGRVVRATARSLLVTLPFALVSVALALAASLVVLNLCARSLDSAQPPPGQTWWVDPWQKRVEGGFWEQAGPAYKLHLACRGAPDPPYLHLSSSNVSFAAPKQPPSNPIPTRTILFESPQGVPGKLAAGWALDLLDQGQLTSADRDVRVCYYDRPGYGFSDNSPTASTIHVVKALWHALSLAGELARIGVPPRSSPPSPLLSSSPEATTLAKPQSGLIIVAQQYGAVPGSLFAALHPRAVHSALYLSPTPPDLHLSATSVSMSLRRRLTFFFTDVVPAFASELGLARWWALMRGRAARRLEHVLSTPRTAVDGRILRAYLQEQHEAHRGERTASGRAWQAAKARYPERETILLTSSDDADARRSALHAREFTYARQAYRDAQKVFVDQVVVDGLRRWDDDWTGECDSPVGKAACARALKELIKLD